MNEGKLSTYTSGDSEWDISDNICFAFEGFKGQNRLNTPSMDSQDKISVDDSEESMSGFPSDLHANTFSETPKPQFKYPTTQNEFDPVDYSNHGEKGTYWDPFAEYQQDNRSKSSFFQGAIDLAQSASQPMSLTRSSTNPAMAQNTVSISLNKGGEIQVMSFHNVSFSLCKGSEGIRIRIEELQRSTLIEQVMEMKDPEKYAGKVEIQRKARGRHARVETQQEIRDDDGNEQDHAHEYKRKKYQMNEKNVESEGTLSWPRDISCENSDFEMPGDVLQVPIKISKNNIKPSYYKNFPKKLIDAYLRADGITGKKRKYDPYYEKIKKYNLRDKASIKKIALCWSEVPEFREGLTRYVLYEIQPEDLTLNQLSLKKDGFLKRECLTRNLHAFKKALQILVKFNLLDDFELVHLWDKVEFVRKKERTKQL